MSWQILNKSALDALREMPAESVHCCVTSPPYWGLRDYGVGGQLGLEKTPDEYVAALVEIFREVKRVLRKDGTLWLNLGDSYAAGKTGRDDSGSNGRFGGPRIEPSSRSVPLGMKAKNLIGVPWRAAFALQADGWYLRSDIIWVKPNPMPESVLDRPTKSHEYIFLFSKQAKYFFDQDAVREPMAPASKARYAYSFGGPKSETLTALERNGAGTRTHPIGDREPTDGRNIRSVWIIPTQPFSEAHFAVYPPALVRRCLLAGTSAHGVCGECGAPWERIVERGQTTGRTSQNGFGNGELGSSSRFGDSHVTTVGWQPTCKHNAEVKRPVVLDPFCGSGTTGLVAYDLNCDFIGIEINPEYVSMAEERLSYATQQARMFV